jgi:two-component system CheB/CheR fusion protein
MKPKVPKSSGLRRLVRREFPIVGIGASAGGLEAFTRLLKRLPVDTGMGFVLVQHLDPQHDSALPQILARATAMPVHEVTNHLRVEPNQVYIIPPNTALGISGGVLKLQPRSKTPAPPRSIDFFFEALAHDQQERAIGMILSGTATDGTLGLEAIKAEGGITFAQDESARYDSMPRSAIGAGCVDLVLTPEAMARELARIARHPFLVGRKRKLALATKDETALPARGGPVAGPEGKPGYQQILRLLRNQTGVDFSLYKTTTIHRRIMRRTVLNKQNTLESYAGFLRGNPKELEALYSDALISVTSFFRNADAFAVLQHKVFPLFLQQGASDPVRVWVLGCSTGQEAYSIAMAYMEVAERSSHPRKLQVFATDLNEANLDKARHGLYAKSLAQDVSPERLRRFFIEEQGGYRVIKSLRDLVVFARQNLISDPPFSRMDLISCRNLMIYLEPSLQKKALPTFHYALKSGGFLFLGASESVGGFTDLFEPVGRKHKIFGKKAASTSMAFHLPVRKEGGDLSLPEKAPRPALAEGKTSGGGDAFRGELNAEREADRVTINQFAPPGVLINADLQILQFRGSTGAYLEPPSGKASFDVLKMARDGLMLPLRAAINRAKQDHKAVRTTDVPLELDGGIRRVNVEVVPLRNLKERCYLILFEDTEKSGPTVPASPESPAGAPPSSRPVSRKEESSRVAGLERALAETRDYIQSVEEQQETANEELQASNEEGQSANEELQSLNEELETSKEELESTNEELTTVNEEMVNRNTELNRVNSDLTNLQTATKLIIVLLDRDLSIRRFSVQAEKKFNLLPGDVGRPFVSVRHTLDVPGLDAVITEVITTVRECEREVRDHDGRWYSLRVRPYISLDNKVDGAVLMLMDINALKVAEQEVMHTRDFAEAIIATVKDPFVVLDANMRVQKANEAFFTTFKIKPADVVGRPLFELSQGQWNIPKLRKLLLKILPRHSSFNHFEVTHHFAGLGRRSLLLNARTLDQGSGHREKILLGIQDVTEQLQTQARMRASELRYRRLFEAAQDGILMLDPTTRKITEANPYILKLLGYSRKQLITKELWEIGLLKDEAANQKAFRELKAKGMIRYEDLPLLSRDGRRHEVEFVSNLYDEGGEPVIQCNIRDITERRQIEQALAEVQAELAAHAGQLEKLVARRTAELTATNQRLKRSADSNRQGKEEYRALFLASEFMQKKLRQMSRQILTAQEDERRTISRELHDQVVQTLVGINVELAALGHATAAGGRPLMAKIARTQRLVEKSVNAVHKFARELRPAVLDDLGLIPALHAYMKTVAARARLKIHLTAFGGVEALDIDNRTVLYRVAQEALINVSRHARASVVKVTISQRPGAVRMDIHDNGKSFRVASTLSPRRNQRLGLLGMRERLEMVGGTLVIESAPGRGTTVRAEIPFRKRGDL